MTECSEAYLSTGVDRPSTLFIREADMRRQAKKPVVVKPDADEDYEEVTIISHTELPARRVTRVSNSNKVRTGALFPTLQYFSRDQPKQLKYVMDKFCRAVDDPLHPVHNVPVYDSFKSGKECSGESENMTYRKEVGCSSGYFSIVMTQFATKPKGLPSMQLTVKPLSSFKTMSFEELNFTIQGGEILDRNFSDFRSNKFYFYCLKQKLVNTGLSSTSSTTVVDLTLNCLDLATGGLETDLSSSAAPFLVGDRYNPELTVHRFGEEQLLLHRLVLCDSAVRTVGPTVCFVYLSAVHSVLTVVQQSGPEEVVGSAAGQGMPVVGKGGQAAAGAMLALTNVVLEIQEVRIARVGVDERRVIAVCDERLVIVDLVRGRLSKSKKLREIPGVGAGSNIVELYALEHAIVLAVKGGASTGFVSAFDCFEQPSLVKKAPQNSLAGLTLVALSYSDLDVLFKEEFAASSNSRFSGQRNTVKFLDQHFGTLFEQNYFIESERLLMQMFTVKKNGFVWISANLSGSIMGSSSEFDVQSFEIYCDEVNKLNRQFYIKLAGTSATSYQKIEQQQQEPAKPNKKGQRENSAARKAASSSAAALRTSTKPEAAKQASPLESTTKTEHFTKIIRVQV